MDSSTSEAALKLEIARLSGAINRHKSIAATSTSDFQSRARNNTYVNPNYTRPSGHVRPGTASLPPASRPALNSRPPIQPREVVLGGVAFQSSARSLGAISPLACNHTFAVPKPAASSAKPPPIPQVEYSRTKTGHLIPGGRIYKSKVSRGRRGRPLPSNRNMTLDNTRRPYQRRVSSKRKYLDKPCPRFTTTGSCSRGLTCMYQHNASKIAICWPFLQGTCPNTADNCNLSHDPIPERTPLCVHFANNGRCTREGCPFPHIRVTARQGVCRDFAVLGYCAKGLECNHQHVRECPDFAENGTCSTKGCKLPHVIRANRNRKPAVTPLPSAKDINMPSLAPSIASHVSIGTDNVSSLQPISAEKNVQLGDEYISLTFNESEDSESDSEEDEDEDEEEDAEAPEDGHAIEPIDSDSYPE